MTTPFPVQKHLFLCKNTKKNFPPDGHGEGAKGPSPPGEVHFPPPEIGPSAPGKKISPDGPGKEGG